MNIDKIIALLENGELDEALIGYEQVLNTGTDDERFTLAEELFRLGFLEETKKLLQVLLDTYPEEGELLVLLAETNLELGEEEEALLNVEKVSMADDVYPQALLLMADLYQMNGLFEVSEQKLLEAKKILREEVVIDFALGELYAHQGRFLEAVPAYEAVLRERQEIAGVNIHQRLAEVYSAGGSFEEALSFYEKALEEKLEINTLFGYGLTALQAGKNLTAIEKLEELQTLDPDYHSLYLPLAQAYEREELLEEAFNTIKAGISHDDFNKDLYFYGGKIALKLANEEEAEKMLREALALDPGFTEGTLVLNKLFLKQERYEDVTGLIEDTDLNEEEEPQLLWDAAISHQQLEEYSMALNKYQQAYTFFKDNKDFLKDYGYFMIEEGKRHEAAEIFNRLQKMEPSNEEYREILDRLTEEF